QRSVAQFSSFPTNPTKILLGGPACSAQALSPCRRATPWRAEALASSNGPYLGQGRQGGRSFGDRPPTGTVMEGNSSTYDCLAGTRAGRCVFKIKLRHDDSQGRRPLQASQAAGGKSHPQPAPDGRGAEREPGTRELLGQESNGPGLAGMA